MTRTDVPTTKREPLTPTEKLALYELRKGLCHVCGGKIDGKTTFIDEHGTPLGLGGSNAIKNRFISHPKCAAVKTAQEDMPRIAKAKRQKIKDIGAAPPPAHPIKSRGFEAPEKERKCADPFPNLPRRVCGVIVKG